MTPKGKKELIKSLTPYIQRWLDEHDPNSDERTDVGWIGTHCVELMATLAITGLELNSDSQAYMIQDGIIEA